MIRCDVTRASGSNAARSVILLCLFVSIIPGCARRGPVRDDPGVRSVFESVDLPATHARVDIGAYDDAESISDPAAGAADTLRRRGTLRIATRVRVGVYEPNQSGRAGGFHIELASAFASWLGVELSVTVVDRIGDYFDSPPSFDPSRLPIDVDLYADTLTIIPERERIVRFVPLIPVRQLIVLGSGIGPGPTDLDGRSIALVRGTSYEEALLSYADERGFVPEIVYVDTTAEMVEAVATGRAEATLQDSVFALNILTEYLGVALGSPFGEVQVLGWGVAKEATGLSELIETFMSLARESGIWERLWIENYDVGYLDYLELIGL